MNYLMKMRNCFALAIALGGLSACATSGGTGADSPTDTQMEACRAAADSYWKATSGSTETNTVLKTAEGGFDVQLTTSDEYRTTCSVSASGGITTRPGW